MKTYLKMFFKKLWAILVRIFLCCVPYWGYIRTGKKDEPETDESNEKEAEQSTGKTE